MIISNQQRTHIKRLHRIQLFAFLSIIVSILALLLSVKNMLLSVVLAFVIYYIFAPIVNRLERKGFNRTLSTAILFLIASVGIALSITYLYPLISLQLASLKLQLPKYINGTTFLIEKTESQLMVFSEAFENINLIEKTEKFLALWTQSLFEDLPNFLSHSLTVTLLAPFFAFFMLKDGPGLSKKFFSFVPNNLFETSLTLKHQLNSQLGSFIRARFLEAAIVGSIVWLGLWVLNFPFATLLAFFAAFANLIPYIGPIIGAAPAVIIALINGNDLIYATIILTPYLIAQFIDLFFIIPLVVAKIVDLHPVVVIISFIVGAEVMGVLGMVIAIPMASVLKVTITSVYMHLVGAKNQ